jgi:hypothetical protein
VFGSFNTATGNQALRVNSNGNGNTAEGFHALANNTGSFNIAVGYTAGANLTTGRDNIDIGAFRCRRRVQHDSDRQSDADCYIYSWYSWSHYENG